MALTILTVNDDGCGRLHMVVDSCGRQSYSSEHTSTPNPAKLNKLKQTRTLRYAFETQRYQRHQPISKKTTVNLYSYIYIVNGLYPLGLVVLTFRIGRALLNVPDR